MVGTYDNDHDEGHDIYLCIFNDCAKDDRCTAIVFRFHFIRVMMAIMSTTKAAGLIEVERGTGGVTISRPLEEKLSEITLADVKKDIAVYILYMKV